MKESVKKAAALAELIRDMAALDVTRACKDDAFGILWLIARPVVTVMVYYIVFQILFGMSVEASGTPYAVWFLSGMLPWLFFAETLGGGVLCYQEYGHLVKKINFPVRTIPAIKVLAGLYIHMIFLAFLLSVAVFCNHIRKIRLPVLLYAVMCLAVFTGVLVKLCAVIRPFLKDVSELTGIILTAGIWTVPVLWDFRKVPAGLRGIFAINPMFHVIQEYRRGLGCGEGECRVLSGIMFWLVLSLLAAASEVVYRRLSPHLADVL
ncbi:MAG: ABC transporter permease [Blautia sp.]|nr:ABC transporter permease [Blautia sp.]